MIKFESEWEVNLKLITVEYIRTNFIFDFLACVPGLLTGEKVLWLYLFKMLRVNRLSRIIAFLTKLSGLLKDRFMKNQIFIDNLYKVLETVFILIFCLHLLVCCFIAIGHIHSQESIDKSWIVKHGLMDEDHDIYNSSFSLDETLKIYWTAWYFVTTSITTIGYGEISGYTIYEEIFIIFLLFTGILIFTTI